MKKISFVKTVWLGVSSIVMLLGLLSKNVCAQTASTYVQSIGYLGAITVDSSGNVFVLGRGGQSIINKITPTGVLSIIYAGIRSGSNQTTFVMDKAGNFFLPDSKKPYGFSTYGISKITSAGVKSIIVDTGSGSVFKQITGLAIDSSGNLFAADYQNNAIYKISTSGVISPFITTGISGPLAMTMDGNGDLFVLNSAGNSIVQIKPDGTISTFYNGNFSDNPIGFAFGDNNNLYVLCYGKKIYKLDASGTLVDSITTANYSNAICVDKLGNIYTGNTNYSVSKISNTGAASYLIPPYIYPNTYLQNILIDNQNNLLFTGRMSDSNKYYINKVSASGAISRFSSNSYLSSIVAMTKDSSGNIYLASDSSIVSIANNGAATTYASTNIVYINTLVKDKLGNLFFSSNNPNLYKISPSKTTTLFAKLPSNIVSTAIDDSGNIYIGCSDTYLGVNTKLYKVDKTGNQTLVLTLGIAYIAGMVFDNNNNLYLSANRYKSILKLSPSGVLSTFVNSNLYGPRSLAFDNDGNLYVGNDSTFIISKIVLQTLPVQLVNFKASISQKAVITNWQTAREKNAKLFEIQRSLDGLSFYTIGQVSAKGNGAHEYSYTDHSPALGVNYYRLQVIDHDGTISFSEIAKVVNGEAADDFAVFPNPAKNIITINGKLINHISLYNAEGKLQLSKDWKDATNPTIDLGQLHSGVYYVHISSSRKTKPVVLPLVKE